MAFLFLMIAHDNLLVFVTNPHRSNVICSPAKNRIIIHNLVDIIQVAPSLINVIFEINYSIHALCIRSTISMKMLKYIIN